MNSNAAPRLKLGWPLLLAALVSCKQAGESKDPRELREDAGAAAPAASSAVQATTPAMERSTTNPPRFVDTIDARVFQKGNLHAHSTQSDGHSSPRAVLSWYRKHGYAFAALTDHNEITLPDSYRDLESKDFVILPGEEISMYAGSAPVHINALCSSRAIGAAPDRKLDDFATVGDALRWAVQQTLAQGAIALVNHPNFVHAFTAEELPAARGAQLLEMWSGHPAVHSEGDGERPSEEMIWDQALTHGDAFAGVAVDDTHFLFLTPGAKWPALPGNGWVQVFSEERSRAAICDALRRGALYSSSGAELRRIRVSGDQISVWPARAARVAFIGEGGHRLLVIHVQAGAEASYRLTGTERYVRVRIKTADGKRAWTQAYWTAR